MLPVFSLFVVLNLNIQTGDITNWQNQRVDLRIAVEFILQRSDCRFEVTEGKMNLYIVPRQIIF